MTVKFYTPNSIEANGWSNPNNMIDGATGSRSECMITKAGVNIKLKFDEIDKSRVKNATLKVYGEAWDYGDGTNIRLKPAISEKEIFLSAGKKMLSLDITEDFKSSFDNNNFTLKVYATNIMWETTAVIGEIYLELVTDEKETIIIDGRVSFDDENKPIGNISSPGINKLRLGSVTINNFKLGNVELTKAYLGSQLVYSKGSGGSTLLTNPTISISKNKYKIRLEQNGYVEYFDCSTSPNTRTPGYVKSKEVTDEKGNTFYLALFNEGETAFRVDGLVPKNGGWTTSTPPLNSHSALLYTGTINLDIGFVNVRNSIPKKVLEDGLRAVNSAIKGLNYHIVDRGLNTGELLNAADNYFGVLYRSVDHFDFKMNSRLMHNFGGEYTGRKENNGWIATFVHELCHSMAIPDGLTHTPTLYYGNINRDVILQSNDIEYVVSEYKRVYGIDLRNLAETNKYVALEKNLLAEYDFYYPYYKDIEKEADLIVEGTLILEEKKEMYEAMYNIYRVNGAEKEIFIKIHEGLEIDFEKDKRYKLYLKTYSDDAYPTLMNDTQSVVEI